MKNTDALDMQGRLTIHAFDQGGDLIHTTQNHNSIVYSGRDLVAKLFTEQKIDPIRYIAVGTGNKAIDPLGDKQLQAEVFRKELKPFDLAKDLTDFLKDGDAKPQTRRRILLSADLDFAEPPPQENGQPYELKEAGLFNTKESKKGIMYNRVIFPNITKTKDFKLTLVWEIIF
jgi:hypothetical protein